jgi:hypothetical protein
MTSAFRALALGSVAALALTSALALAQENAPGAAAPGSTAPDATAPGSSSGEAPAQAPAQKSEWPCEQTERPEISVTQVWQGPDPSAAEETWRSNPAVVALVEQIAPRRMPQDEAVAAVHRFSAGYKEDRAAVLTALFAGLFETMSDERGQIMRGIKHFNRRQDSLSERIQDGWKQMDALDPSSADPKIVEQRVTLQQTIDWDSRIFDDRERLLPVICQQPSVIEQRLFALSRAIQEDLNAPATNP